MRLWIKGLLAAVLACWAGAAPAQNMFCATQICTTSAHFFSAASTNPTNVKAAPGALYSIVATNTTTTVYYLKLYDKATAPTCNTDTVLQTYALKVAAASSAETLPLSFVIPLGFNSGISFCLTGGSADNDNTNAATGVIINLLYR